MWRLLVLPLQIVSSGVIGLYVASMILLALQAVDPPARKDVPIIVILGGAVIGFLVWLFGLLVDRFSLICLALTVVLSILGLTVSYVLVEVSPLWGRLLGPEGLLTGLPIFAAFAAPTAGALAGYYTPRLKPYLRVSPRPLWFKGLVGVVCAASVAIVPVVLWLLLAWINRK